MKRPALKKLLDDLKAGKVDCVVVSTLDRLTRSHADLATLVATFQQCGVMLVIVSPTTGLRG
jgi:site-specific DNA recombinase